MFCKKGGLANLAKSRRKHLCQGFFFNKVAGLRPVNFAKFPRTPFFTEHLPLLTLHKHYMKIVNFFFFFFFWKIKKKIEQKAE